MIGIYKIENKLNGKCYIGQSTDIERRWKAHKIIGFNKNSHNYNYPLYKAIRKYGIENFSFSVIEKCKKEQLNEKEQKWIEYYDSFNNGYNQTLGGEQDRFPTPPNVLQAIKDLKETTLTFEEIADKNQISYDMLTRINRGKFWNQNDETYPIRSKKKRIEILKINNIYTKEEHFCIDCGKLLGHNYLRCRECQNIYFRTINNSTKPTKEKLLEELKEYQGNLSQIGRIHNVCNNSVKKWCKTYNIDYKSYWFTIKKEEIMKSLNKNKQIKKTCDELNISEKTFKKYCKEYDIDYDQYLYHKPTKEEIITLLKETNGDLEVISKMLNCTRGSVSRYLKQYNLKKKDYKNT